jgi:ferredoxin
MVDIKEPEAAVDLVQLAARAGEKDRPGTVIAEGEEKKRAKKKAKRIANKCDHCFGYDDMACISACPTGAIIQIDPRALFRRDGGLIDRAEKYFETTPFELGYSQTTRTQGVWLMYSLFALATIGDAERARPTLERLAGDSYEVGDHRVVRAFASLAFGRLADRRGIGRLTELAKDEDGVVRWHAAVALGDVGSAEGVAALIGLLGDAIPFCRAHAAIALAQIGDPAAIPALEKTTGDGVPRVAKIAQESLDALRALPRKE